MLKICQICKKFYIVKKHSISQYQLQFSKKQNKILKSYLKKHKNYVCSQCKTELFLSQLL